MKVWMTKNLVILHLFSEEPKDFVLGPNLMLLANVTVIKNEFYILSFKLQVKTIQSAQQQGDVTAAQYKACSILSVW